MHDSGVFRFAGGISSILTALLVLAASLLDYVNETGDATIAGRGLIFAAHILVVFVFAAIYEQHKEEGIFFGGLAFILGVIGTVITSSVVFVEIAGAAGIAIEPLLEVSILKIISISGIVLLVVGMLLLGLAIILAGILSRWGGWLLIIGTIVCVLGSFETNIASILMIIGAAFSFGGFLLVGATLLKDNERSEIFINRTI